MNLPSHGLAAGCLIGARYRVEERFGGTTSHPVFDGLRVETGEGVSLFEVDAAYAKVLNRAKGIQHAHLVRVYDVSEFEGKMYLVHERVRGSSLSSGTPQVLVPVEAVRAALRLTEALTALHREEAVHGLVHPGSVILDPEKRPGPVLSFAPSEEEHAAFRPPHPSGSAPAEKDDVWGIAAILHLLLLGTAPPRSGYETAAEFEAAGITDPALTSVLFAALARKPEERSQTLQPLRRALARWFVQRTSEGPASGPLSSDPPPLPLGEVTLTSSSALLEQSPSSIWAPGGSAKIPLLAALGIVLGLSVGWFYSSLHKRPKIKVVEVPPAAKAYSTGAPDNQPINLSEVAVTGKQGLVTHDKTAACLASHWPEGSFSKPPDVSWLCQESDPRTGAEKLRRVLLADTQSGTPSEAAQLIERMGSYDMAAFSLVHSACCENPAPLKLDLPSGPCGSLLDALSQIGQNSQTPESLGEPLKSYGASLRCALEHGQSGLLRAKSAGDETAFLELLHHLE